MTGDVWKILGKSLFQNDKIILFAAIITAVAFIILWFLSHAIERRVKDWKKNKNKAFSRSLYDWTRRALSVFTTLISIFPLLGMLGTVFGLLGLDLATGDMENIKANFFVALTSTAWGIIFSVIYKLLYSWFAEYIDEQIETAKKLSDV